MAAAPQTTKGFAGRSKAGAAAPAAAAAPAQPAGAVATGAATGKYEDHYADVTQMDKADGRTSKYVKFVKDIQDPATGLFIPKGTIFDFETFQDIYDRTPNPSEKMLNWLNERQKPFVTATGATLTGIGQIKKPFKPST